jgi:uncharacterized protein (DUF1501 family)
MSPSRRDFLKAALGVPAFLSLGAAAPAFLARAGRAQEARRDADGKVLVVVQLSGGNDGLNTVVPFEDDIYSKSRPTLRLKAGDLHRIDRSLGFHPEMERFLRLYEKGDLSILQGVGYPGSSRDHDDAMRHWHTGRPGEAGCQTGWLGRTIDRFPCEGGAGVPGAFVGEIERPFSLNAERAIVPSIRSPGELTLRGFPGPGGAARISRPPNPLADLIQRETVAAGEASRRIEAAARAPAPAGYPDFKLAETLATVARLIRAEAGIRIFFTEFGGGGIGGFDTHAHQSANHGALLRQLTRSVAAFVEDLRGDRLLDRVLLLTFSEFGRTIGENGRRGTDHGAAAPLFLLGGTLKGGLVGAHPSLADAEEGGLKAHTDFRRVYATVLEKWLGIESRPILGGEFESLDVFRA